MFSDRNGVSSGKILFLMTALFLTFVIKLSLNFTGICEISTNGQSFNPYY